MFTLLMDHKTDYY